MFHLSFQEWFDKEYPEEYFKYCNMTRQDLKDIMKEAWEASRNNMSWSDL
jgi:hypothetical protein